MKKPETLYLLFYNINILILPTVFLIFTGTGSATKFPCLPGTYSNRTDLFNASQCDICDPGKYCPGGEATPRGSCPPGHYCPAGTRVAEQFPCPNGTYNPEFGKSSVDQCLNCTQGHFCEKGTVQPVPCPIGTYISLYIIFLLSFKREMCCFTVCNN